MSKTIKKSNKAISFFLCVIIFAFTFVSTPVVTPVVSAADTNDDGGSGVVVSLGDSYASGEGIPEFYEQNLSIEEKVTKDDWLAHRSTKSWAGQLIIPGTDGKPLSTHKDKTWFFKAASGAETTHIFAEFRKDYNKIIGYEVYGETVIPKYLTDYEYLDPQLDVFQEVRDKGLEVEYVTLSLGGNDARFTEIIKKAAMASIYLTNPNNVAADIQKSFDDFYKDKGIRYKLYAVYKAIEEEAGSQAKIIVTGYPKLIDVDGKGFFSKEVAKIVNDAVTRFNDEIETLVHQCKAEGMKICFVDIEEYFGNSGAGSKNKLVQGVQLLARSEDLDDSAWFSSYSMHPNKEGAKEYAKCVQDKIDSIEKDGGKSEWPLLVSSDERDVVLVLDSSGSMDGKPMQETKEASKKFIETVFQQDASVGIVTYDSSAYKVANFCRNTQHLNDVIDALNPGSSTNIEDGLVKAEEMLKTSKAKKKLIVLMSDGLPNEGKEGDELIEYADELKKQGIYIYTLGFFSSMNSNEKKKPQQLMEKIASEGCHFEVDDADSLVYFFEDIANQIQGQKYIYVKIACPVDVIVEYNGEKLESKGATSNQRAEFGTLTFEENTNDHSEDDEDYEDDEDDEESDTRVKILRLKEGAQYDIRIEGNGKGTMDYTIGFMDENGEYSDMREFNDIKINKSTEIDTVAAVSETTYLKVDDDGDGKYDQIFRADKGGKAILIESNLLTIIIIVVSSLVALLVIEIIARQLIRNYTPKQKPVMAIAGIRQSNVNLNSVPQRQTQAQPKPPTQPMQKNPPIQQNSPKPAENKKNRFLHKMRKADRP